MRCPSLRAARLSRVRVRQQPGARRVHVSTRLAHRLVPSPPKPLMRIRTKSGTLAASAALERSFNCSAAELATAAPAHQPQCAAGQGALVGAILVRRFQLVQLVFQPGQCVEQWHRLRASDRKGSKAGVNETVHTARSSAACSVTRALSQRSKAPQVGSTFREPPVRGLVRPATTWRGGACCQARKKLHQTSGAGICPERYTKRARKARQLHACHASVDSYLSKSP